jgi:hypothetical protein
MNIAGALVLGAGLLWLSGKTSSTRVGVTRNPAASPEEIENRKRELAVFDERLAQQRRRLANERSAIDSRNIARYGRRLLIVESTPELLAAQDAIKRLEVARRNAFNGLSLALQRNPVQSLDKLEAQTRKLAMDARGPSASVASKAKYRRSLDQLMAARIDAGVQRTLFDIEPANNTQRALPGLFE